MANKLHNGQYHTISIGNPIFNFTLVLQKQKKSSSDTEEYIKSGTDAAKGGQQPPHIFQQHIHIYLVQIQADSLCIEDWYMYNDDTKSKIIAQLITIIQCND